MTADLLALLIELTSVIAAGKQIKKTVEIPRPKVPKKPYQERTDEEKQAAMSKGIAMLRGTAKAVRR